MSEATPTTMTKAEREELAKILAMRARVSKSVTEQRAAELRADVEQQLATIYKIDDAKWRDLTAMASQAVHEADQQIAARCRALGVPEEFRPSLDLNWYGRGENASASRRAELRKVAYTRIEALTRQARVTIETKALEGRELLARGLLASAEAQAFLAAMPTVEGLMPRLDVTALPRALRAVHGDTDGLRLLPGAAEEPPA